MNQAPSEHLEKLRKSASEFEQYLKSMVMDESGFEEAFSRLKELYRELILLEQSALPEEDEIQQSEVRAYVEQGTDEHTEAEEPEILEVQEIEQVPEVGEHSEDDPNPPEELMEEIAKEESSLDLAGGIPIHEQLETEDKSIATQLEKSPISDLKKAIGLNERFYFANELFSGDGKAYSNAIDEFNHLSSLDDAHRLIDSNYRERYGWSNDSEALAEFIGLLERRYL